MDNDKVSTDDLVTSPPSASAAKAAPHPAATENPDPAAKLDPAKVAPEKAAKPKKRKRPAKARRAKAQEKAANASGEQARSALKASKLAHEARAAASAERSEAYKAAKLNAVDVFADLPKDGPLRMRLADGSAFIDGEMFVNRADFEPEGGRATYKRPVEISPEGPAVRVTEVWIIAASGEAACCEISGGLGAGGGHRAEIPAGHLLF